MPRKASCFTWGFCLEAKGIQWLRVGQEAALCVAQVLTDTQNPRLKGSSWAEHTRKGSYVDQSCQDGVGGDNIPGGPLNMLNSDNTSELFESTQSWTNRKTEACR